MYCIIKCEISCVPLPQNKLDRQQLNNSSFNFQTDSGRLFNVTKCGKDDMLILHFLGESYMER